MTRTGLRWPHELPVSDPGRLEDYAPEPLPEPARSQADRLNAECHDRILAAICRPSGKGAPQAAADAIRRAGGGRSHGRVLRPLRRDEGVA